MPNEIVDTGGDYPEWIDRIDLPDLIGEAGELSKYMPYAKYVVGAYRWYRGYRARHFLKSLSTAADSFDKDGKARLEELLRSKEGGELLSEFVKTILNTSSKSAITAMALLYADVYGEKYSTEFKLSAVNAFEGISEQSIDAFLALSSVDSFIHALNLPKVPYPVAIASDKLISGLSSPAKEILEPPEIRVTIISDLIRRGLLLPDFASARLGDGGVGLTFGISDFVYKFVELMQRARSLLPLDN